MMSHRNRKPLALRLLCLLALASACSHAGDGGATKDAANRSEAASERKTPGASAVRASVSEARVAAGQSGEANVLIHIAEGLHVNANPASDKYLIATTVEAAPAEGLRVGAPVYPPGVTKKFGFSEQPLSVYEGDVSVRLPLSVEPGAAKGRRALDASVTVQPCNDKECFQPRTINAAIPVVIE